MDYSFDSDQRFTALEVAGEVFPAARVPARPPVAERPPTLEKPARARVATRNPVDLQAGARKRGGSGTGVRVTDLSTHGFCMETHLLLAPGTDVWLRLPSLEMRHARVAWTRGALVGCAFEAPLSPFVVALVLERARTGA